MPRHSRPNINITTELEVLVADLCARVPEFAHIDPRRVLLCLTRARARAVHVTYAKIVPMRFANGTPFKTVGEQVFSLPQIPTPAGDVLYLIYLYVPRFFDQPFERRLLTLIHELYHIAPAFDGTIRRVGSRAHGTSRERYNALLQPLLDTYLAADPPEELLTLLKSDLSTLARANILCGRSLPLPKTVRLI